jgi:hypothetical protein
VLTQITLEATSGQQTGVIAIRGNQHEGAGFSIGRARRMYKHAYSDGVTCGAFSIKERKKRAK